MISVSYTECNYCHPDSIDYPCSMDKMFYFENKGNVLAATTVLDMLLLQKLGWKHAASSAYEFFCLLPGQLYDGIFW